MCKFFSFVTEPENHGGQRFYFNKSQREDKKIKEQVSDFDSHSSICKFYGIDEDSCNKYEHDFEANKCETDQINSDVNDSSQAHEWAENLKLDSILDTSKCKLRVGDVYTFKTLKTLKSREFDCGLADNGFMDIYVKEKMEFVVNEAVIARYVTGNVALWTISDENSFRGYWNISLDMLKLKK